MSSTLNKKPTRNRFIIIGGLSLILLILFLAFSLPHENGNKSLPENPDLILLDSTEMNINGGIITVEGKVQNSTEYTWKNVKIEFNLLNHDGEVVGVTQTSIDHLYGNNIWVFSSYEFFPMDMQVETYELKSLEGTKTSEIVNPAEFIEKEETDSNVLTYDEYRKITGEKNDTNEIKGEKN